MPRAAEQEALVDRRDHFVVLRLVTEIGGRLVHGEVVDVDGVRRGAFEDWRGMTLTIRQWLASEATADSRPGSDTATTR